MLISTMFRQKGQACIFTHTNVDLDAAASVWAAKKYVPGMNKASVVFVPANWDGADMLPGDIAVDIYAGGKGVKGEVWSDGKTHCAFMSIVKQYAPSENKLALRNLMEFIDAGDTASNPIRALAPEANSAAQRILFATSLGAVLVAIKTAANGLDSFVLERMAEIFDGFLKTGQVAARAYDQAAKIPVVDGVAIVRNKGTAVRVALMDEFGARLIVFVDDQNNATGVFRKDGETMRADHPLIRKVAEAAGEEISGASGGEEGKWFAHHDGLLFCWGSKKAPAKTKSRVRAEDLAEAVRQALRDADKETANADKK